MVKFTQFFYFSKCATECETNYHSYELEYLAIIYSIKIFQAYNLQLLLIAIV